MGRKRCGPLVNVGASVGQYLNYSRKGRIIPVLARTIPRVGHCAQRGPLRMALACLWRIAGHNHHARMCHHPISLHAKQAHTDHGASVDREMACEAYDAYAPAVYGALLRVVQCTECASDVMIHTFVQACPIGGAKPSLAHLLRVSFALACGALDNESNRAVQVRIRAWYLEAQTLSTLPKQIGNEPDGFLGYGSALRC